MYVSSCGCLWFFRVIDTLEFRKGVVFLQRNHKTQVSLLELLQKYFTDNTP